MVSQKYMEPLDVNVYRTMRAAMDALRGLERALMARDMPDSAEKVESLLDGVDRWLLALKPDGE